MQFHPFSRDASPRSCPESLDSFRQPMGKGIDPLGIVGRSRAMARIRGTGNESTELAMVRLLRACGIRGWRRHVGIRIPPSDGCARRLVRPDFVFVRARLAIFIDGCFWHGCPLHGTQPRNNAEFWKAKIDGNRRRDRRNRVALRALGWTTMHVWEHSLRRGRMDPILKRIRSVLDSAEISRLPP